MILALNHVLFIYGKTDKKQEMKKKIGNAKTIMKESDYETIRNTSAEKKRTIF